MVADRKVGVERRQGESTPRADSAGDAGQDSPIVGRLAHETKSTLAQADRGIEVIGNRRRLTEHSGVVTFDHGPVETLAGCRRSGQCNEGLADVDSVDPDSTSRQLQRVSARTAPDIEHCRALTELEHLGEEIDFLTGSFGERVAKIRRTEMFGDGFEPVIVLRRSAHDFAAPHDSPHEKLTSRGTFSSAACVMMSMTVSPTTSRSESATSTTTSSWTWSTRRLAPFDS